jgi:ribosomal protein S27AE
VLPLRSNQRRRLTICARSSFEIGPLPLGLPPDLLSVRPFDFMTDQPLQETDPATRSRQFSCENCGKQYFTAHHLDTHQSRSCARTKRGLSELLKETRDFWELRKRRRLEAQSSIQLDPIEQHLESRTSAPVSFDSPKSHVSNVSDTSHPGNPVRTDHNAICLSKLTHG